MDHVSDKARHTTGNNVFAYCTIAYVSHCCEWRHTGIVDSTLKKLTDFFPSLFVVPSGVIDGKILETNFHLQDSINFHLKLVIHFFRCIVTQNRRHTIAKKNFIINKNIVDWSMLTLLLANKNET